MKTCKMKFLRFGVSKRDKVRSETVREQLEEQLILNRIERYKLNWCGYMKKDI